MLQLIIGNNKPNASESLKKPIIIKKQGPALPLNFPDKSPSITHT